MKATIEWKEMGQFLAMVVRLYSIVSETFKKLNVGLEAVEWVIGSGKDFLVGKLTEVGEEFNRLHKPLFEAEINLERSPRIPKGLKLSSLESHTLLFLPDILKVETWHNGLRLNGKKVALLPLDKSAGRALLGRMLAVASKHKEVLTAHFLDYLMDHPEAFPGTWADGIKKPHGSTMYVIHFGGTIYEDEDSEDHDGDNYIRYCWYDIGSHDGPDGCWREGVKKLDSSKFDDNHVVPVRE